MDGGAALRARAISASRSGMRYWSSGAMLGYGFLASSCACARQAPSMKAPNAIVFISVRFIEFSLQRGFNAGLLTCDAAVIVDSCLIIPTGMYVYLETHASWSKQPSVPRATSRRHSAGP